MKKPASVHIDIAEFSMTVMEIPATKRGEWLDSFVKCLALNKPNLNSYGAKLLAESQIRDDPKYYIWRSSVYKRDNYACKNCGSSDRLNAHHIKSWKDHPFSRYDIENGITLCRSCHIAEHKRLRGIK